MRIGAVLCVGIIVFMGPAVSARTLISLSPGSSNIVIVRKGAVMAAGHTMRIGVRGTESLFDQLVLMLMNRGKAEACNGRDKNNYEDYSNGFFHTINLSVSLPASCSPEPSADRNSTCRHGPRKRVRAPAQTRRPHRQVHQDSSQFLLHLGSPPFFIARNLRSVTDRLRFGCFCFGKLDFSCNQGSRNRCGCTAD